MVLPDANIPNGHDYSASKRSKWLKLLVLAATNRKISSKISVIYTYLRTYTCKKED